ncbi:hypothetical protein SARC_05631 [Sphaeroforma arctica JP610]|uniref:EXPERA domain-containing protein n=1 Tax=Sphaeroforma arctica JP610 TaxID=667725 RepID=A0A0L0FZ44_9EUKA|nr:hypothetical protein SARC_05631 [Sphaeroforma arctica JP610]KNC82080.1 hypothetical protein SARC_05631 [Sphaeroforma arctica JP610]|eukprot:XP_014155982.1 hypothetical protein SARC_05631 [Sphaeroforma arctica JP610]
MLVIILLCLLMGPPVIVCGFLHYVTYGWNSSAQALILFLLVNTLICLWELVLYYKYDRIHNKHTKRIKDNFYTTQPQSEDFIFVQDVPITKAFCPDLWSQIWIDYGYYDPSYADKTTFGFNIDVGNGHSTLLPSLLMAVSIISPIFSAKVTGMLGMLLFYQTWYGTVVYFFSYVNCGRYLKSAWSDIGVVLFANCIWIVFPVLGFYCSVKLIMEESFACLQ